MPEKNQFIFIIRGKTGSGKTKLLDKIFKEFKFKKISLDEIKKEIPKMPNRTKTIFKEAGIRADELLKQGCNIVVEEAFLDKEHLKSFFQMIEEKERYVIKYILLECSLETAVLRKNNLIPKIIQHQFSKQLDEIEDELIFNTDKMSTDEVFNQIKKQI